MLKIFCPDKEGFTGFNLTLHELEEVDGFTIHRLPSLQFLLSSTLGIGDVNYFERSHAESLAPFYSEAATKDLRERFEESERGDLR